MQADANAVAATPDAAKFFQDLGGAEMWSRWDMQDQPPDILITNYSMLNIMLMRNVEAPIFDATRHWLESDSRNVFHLVVDELHTYRGTPGTEVAYLLRVLLDRLGLHPNHDQLRIIASSASLESGGDGLEYLGGLLRPGPRPLHDHRRPAAADRQHPGSRNLGPLQPRWPISARGLAAGQPSSPASAAAAFEANAGSPPQAGAAPEARLGTALADAGAVDAIRQACSTGAPVRSRPQQASQIAEALFPGQPNARAAAEGIIAGVSVAQTPAGTPLLPVRAHIMFRNVQGLWACSDAACATAPPRTDPGPVGALHHLPTLGCGCGVRVLELLYCEPCGEVFLGGYRGDAGNPGAWRPHAGLPRPGAGPRSRGSGARSRQQLRDLLAGRGPSTPATPSWQGIEHSSGK